MLARVPHLVDVTSAGEDEKGLTMKVHELRPPAGANRARRRVGRGIAGKGGKTAGRGTKGQGARDTIPMGFEGGQLPLMQRIPKLRGFTNPFRVEYTPVNVGALEAVDGDIGRHRRPGGRRARPQGRPGQGPRRRRADPGPAGRGARVLQVGRGGHHRRRGHRSPIVPLPFGNDRPPAKGNALTNR